MFLKISSPLVIVFLVSTNVLFAQFTKDIKLKLSAGLYGLTPLSSKYIEEYAIDQTLNYSLGLEKDFNWIVLETGYCAPKFYTIGQILR